MSGYLRRPGRDRPKRWREGWLHTGDIAPAMPRAYLTIVDRRKE